MAINSKLKYLMLTALFLYGFFSVQAQTAGYFLDPDSVEPRFIQRLAWSGGMYARHCEIILEKEEGAGYVNYLRQFTTGNYFDISLPPGNYRFRVIPYDILDKPTAGTQWEPFTVFNAIKPELYQPEEKTNYVNDEQGATFVFNGKNIEPEAEIYFINSKGDRIVPVEIIRNEDGSDVILVFKKEQLMNGQYEIFIINPGGLETSLGGIDYKAPRIQFVYIFGFSLMPVLPVYGEWFGYNPVLYNISARISMTSCMFLNNYIGLEFTFFRCMDDTAYTIRGNSVGFNFLFINWFPNKTAAFNLRAGVALITNPTGFGYANIGFSYLYRILYHFNFEAGINYNYSLIDAESGAILPWVGVSLMF